MEVSAGIAAHRRVPPAAASPGRSQPAPAADLIQLTSITAMQRPGVGKGAELMSSGPRQSNERVQRGKSMLECPKREIDVGKHERTKLRTR